MGRLRKDAEILLNVFPRTPTTLVYFFHAIFLCVVIRVSS